MARSSRCSRRRAPASTPGRYGARSTCPRISHSRSRGSASARSWPLSRIPAMSPARDFSRRAGLQAYFVAFFSLAYAAVFLGLVHSHPEAHRASALANALIAAGGLSATIAIVGVTGRIAALDGRWLAALGVGYALLSATHGVYSALAELGAIGVPDLAPTDPRGVATFGLAGLWVFTFGLVIRAGNVPGFPRGLATLAIVDGVDLVLLFVATVAAAENLVLVSGGLASVVLGPAFWIWTGRVLRR